MDESESTPVTECTRVVESKADMTSLEGLEPLQRYTVEQKHTLLVIKLRQANTGLFPDLTNLIVGYCADKVWYWQANPYQCGEPYPTHTLAQASQLTRLCAVCLWDYTHFNNPGSDYYKRQTDFVKMLQEGAPGPLVSKILSILDEGLDGCVTAGVMGVGFKWFISE